MTEGNTVHGDSSTDSEEAEKPVKHLVVLDPTLKTLEGHDMAAGECGAGSLGG